MDNPRFDQPILKRKVLERIVVALGVAAFYWVLDSFVGARLCNETDFFTHLFQPSNHEMWHRLTIFSFLFGVAICFQIIIYKRELVELGFKRRNKDLAALNKISSTISQSLNLEQILQDALAQIQQLDLVGEQIQNIIFLRKGRDELVPVAHLGTPLNHPCLTQPPRVGQCLCGKAVKTGEVVLSEACRQNIPLIQLTQQPDHKDICLPLKARGKIMGVLNARLPVDQEISTDDIKLLEAITDQISVAIENARLFEAVSKQRERLRLLSSRIAETEEAERRRIAGELHDQVGQNLTALGINLNIIRAETMENGKNGANSRLDDSLALVEQTTEQIRMVMAELRPPMLDDCGLLPTLRWYAERFSERTGIKVSVIGDEQGSQTSQRKENVLFRIAQEALNNVAKHSKAENVVLTYDMANGFMQFAISDDGVGFDPEAGNGFEGIKGWGLLLMTERAEAVGGRLWIEPGTNGGGAQVKVEIPR